MRDGARPTRIRGAVASNEDLAATDLLTLIAEQRQSLREMLASFDQATVARRPPNGRWSVLENVRHLLFAEQAHLGGYLPGGRRWSPLGYTPQTMRAARDVSPANDAPLPALAEVMTAWDEHHLAIADVLRTQDSAAVRAALTRNLKHLRAHVNVVRRLVRDT